MAPSPEQGPESRVRSLYEQLLNSWNCMDATGFAALFAEDGEAVGFDGSQMAGRNEIAATLRHIFTGHRTGAYVALVRTVRFPVPEVAVLRAEAGMVPPGGRDIDPALNAVQVLVATRAEAGWRIVSFQNTPAQFHGRPEQAAALTAELHRQLQQPAP
ncbi:MAG TPA: SgcJ/EcaC family oxidoreductase [Rhodocyclaceae bacterium]|nr:SgcJ/EcaC family oxidoreductase [Rhodocyclaceae bacterium]